MPSSLGFILYSSFFNLFRVLCRAHFNTNFERLWIKTDCYYKGNYKWGRLTSSLQISLMKCWASFMAPGVGANTEKVSSSTWLIVTPKGKEENVVTFLYSAQQFLLWKNKSVCCWISITSPSHSKLPFSDFITYTLPVWAWSLRRL